MTPTRTALLAALLAACSFANGGAATDDTAGGTVSGDTGGSCACDRHAVTCDAMTNASAEDCPCDPSCQGADDLSCLEDGQCDDWCDPSDVCLDPDCSTDAIGSCEES